MGRPAVFLVPHPDDEVLSMGIAIAEHVAYGREVHVVLVTQGRQTGAINHLNGEGYNSWWKGTHQPSAEGYSSLSVQDISIARIQEFRSACGCLQVPQANIHIEDTDNPSSDGKEAVTYEEAKQVIQKYIDRYPDADFFSMSWHDQHPDHIAIGQALRDLKKCGAIQGATRFYISRLYWDEFSKIGGWEVPSNMTNPETGVTTTAEEIKERVLRACRAYSVWNPIVGSYGVGRHSVPGQFASLEQDVRNRVHDETV